jgi:hypothetical protein
MVDPGAQRSGRRQRWGWETSGWSSGSDTNVTASPNFTSTNSAIVITLKAGTSVTVTTSSAGTNGQALTDF